MKNIPTVYIVGKIIKGNYTILLVRYYDIDSARYYFMTFDKYFNVKSSVCCFAYATVDPDDVYNSKDKKYYSSFIRHNFQKDSLKVYTKGFINIDYLLNIQHDGRIDLVQKVEEYEEEEL